MAHRDEFSKWMSTVEEAMTGSKMQRRSATPLNECNCGSWDCPTCFPDRELHDIHGDHDDAPMNTQLATSKNEIEFDEYMEEDQGFNNASAPDARYQSNSRDDGHDLISVIKYMQDMGLSNSDRMYREQELSNMSLDQLEEVHNEVTGNSSAATPPAPADNEQESDISEDEYDSFSEPMLPLVTPQDMSPSDSMRNLMNLMNPSTSVSEVPDIEFAYPDTSENELPVTSGSDIPGIIRNAMLSSGIQSPDWHLISNLPGVSDENIADAGQQVFNMFTTTPVGQIQTIANVDGQGPNTEAEMSAVAGWLRDNTEDLGKIEVDHGTSIQGYKPDVKEYRMNDVRFHVVRDQAGQYIYAYPESAAKLNKNSARQDSTSGYVPGLYETRSMSLFNELRLDEELKASLNDLAIEEAISLDESELSKKIAWFPGPPGKQKRNQGGWNLLQLLHKNHKLSDEAEMDVLPFNRNVLYNYFKNDPDHFIIVKGSHGVAAIRPSEESIKHLEAYRARTRKWANWKRDPNEELNYPDLRYHVIAFQDSGKQLDSSLFKDTEAEEAANLKKAAKAAKANKAGKVADDEDEFMTDDPTVQRTRMGLFHTSDSQKQADVFTLLADEIGKLSVMYISGFYALRADSQKGFEQDVRPHTGSVERRKMAHRSANPGEKGIKKPVGGFTKEPSDIAAKDLPATAPDWAKPGATVKTKPYPAPEHEVDESKSSQQAQRKGRDEKKNEIRRGREKMRFDKPVPMRPELDPRVDTRRVFDRLRPILQPIVDRAANGVSMRLHAAETAGNRKEVEALNNQGKLIDEFSSSISNGGQFVLSGNAARIYDQVLSRVIGSPADSPEFEQSVHELATGNSVDLFPLARALSARLLSAANTSVDNNNIGM